MKILTINRPLASEAEHHFARVDQRLSVAMKEIGPCLLANRKRQPFRALVSAVTGQQLSEQAASSIRRKLVDSLGSNLQRWPEQLANSRVDHLTRHGLSGAKARCLISLAQATISGGINFDDVAKMPDEQVVEVLVGFKGIGRWTAEMFLIFGLKRPDVFSLGDTGLRRGAQLVYGLNNRPDEEEFTYLAKSWKPYRTIASWYLWQILDAGQKKR